MDNLIDTILSHFLYSNGFEISSMILFLYLSLASNFGNIFSPNSKHKNKLILGWPNEWYTIIYSKKKEKEKEIQKALTILHQKKKRMWWGRIIVIENFSKLIMLCCLQWLIKSSLMFSFSFQKRKCFSSLKMEF